LQVDAEGFVDLNGLEALLRAYNREGQHGKQRITLAAVSGASNVLGVCNNIMEISRIVHRYGARLLVDAAQLVAHRKIRMEESGIDYLAFSAHKVYAPFGCGALVARKGLLAYSPAEMEQIRLSGEENAGGIAALGKALLLLQRIGMDLIQEEEQALTVKALRGLAKIAGLRIYGVKDPDSPVFAHKIGVIPFDMKSMMPKRVAKELALRGGIGVRSGCHCAHMIVKHILNIKPSLEWLQRVIQILFPRFRFLGVVRVSLGIENSVEDVDTLLRVLSDIAGKSKKSEDRSAASAMNGTPGLRRKDAENQIKDFTHAVAGRVYS
jgi:selenocysteine lyase/cysteine desulfurase